MKKYIVAAGLFLLMNSCLNNDFMEVYPKDQQTELTSFRSYENFKTYSWGLYNVFFGYAYKTGQTDEIFKGDYEADNMIKHVSGNESQWAYQKAKVPASSDSWDYEYIRRVNLMLDNIDQSSMNDAEKAHWRSVGYFFRAYKYFKMLSLYGDLPWVEHTLSEDSEELYLPRDPRDVVAQNILNNLKYAEEHIKVDGDGNNTINRAVVQSLISRFCLFEGTFRKYHGLNDWEKYLRECASASDIFINESGYTVYTAGSTPYFNLFGSLNAEPTEIILAKDYNAALGLTNIVQAFCNSPGEANSGVTKRFVNSYLMKDGSRFTDKSNYETIGFVEEMKNRDPRLTQTIRAAGYVRDDGKKYLPNFKLAKLGYHLKKYDCGVKYDMSSESDLPLFRTAEVYLNCAEAKAELGTLTQDDLNKTINKLRARVNMPNLLMATANANPDPYLKEWYPHVESDDNQGIILEIRRERAIELVMEGFRYYDIMRWKEGKIFEKPFLGIYFPGPGEYDLDGDGTNDVYLYLSTDKGNSSCVDQFEIGGELSLDHETSGNLIIHQSIKRVWNEDKDYLYPIPTKDRVLTNGALTQNPGWNDGLIF